MGDRQAELQQQTRALQLIIETERTATDLTKDKQFAATHMNMSVEATKRDIATIDEAFMTRDLVLSKEMQDRLHNAHDRAEAHLLVNSHKSMGDSFKMRAVKKHVLEVEQLLDQQITRIDVAYFEKLSLAYDAAIKSCMSYCDRKEPRFEKGQERRAQVESNMRRLMREAARIDEVKVLFERGILNEEIHRGSDLLFMGQIHDYAVNFSQAQTVEQLDQAARAQVQQGAEEKKKAKPKKMDPSLAMVLKALTVPEEKRASSKKRVADETGKLRRFLAEFPTTGLHSAYIQMGGKLVNFIQDDTGNLVIKVGNASVQVPESVRILRERIESKMIERSDDMNAADITELFDAQVNVAGGDIVQSRALFARYLELKTKKAATIFNNMGFQELRLIALYISQGGNADTALEAVKSRDSALLINGYETLDIVDRALKKKDEVKSKVLYTSDETLEKALESQRPLTKEMAERIEEEYGGWTKEEAQVKNLVSDMIFSYDTWDADETLAKPGDRILRVITKNTDILSKLFVSMSQSDKEHPDILRQLFDKMPFEAMGADPDELYDYIKEAVDSVNKAIDDGIAQTEKEMRDGGMPEWLIKMSAPKIKERVANMRKDPELIRQYLDNGLATGMLDAQIRARAIEVESRIDDFVAQKSQDIQEKINSSVGSVFGGESTSQAQDQQHDQQPVQTTRPQAPEPIPSPDDAPNWQEKQRRIKLGAERLNKMLEDSVKGEAGQGLFIKETFKHYFQGASLMDKRAMFAAAVRNAKPKEEYPEEIKRTTDVLTEEQMRQLDAQIAERDKKIEEIDKRAMGSFLGGMLKGAGPLFQKMLQGLPIDSMPEEIRGALKDVKSKLAPIPREIVEAHLMSMIERSGGKITQIRVDRALGAASVGQTFLCRMYGPDLPEDGKPCVVKLLKPDVRNRMMREKAVMLSCARMTDNIQRQKNGMEPLKANEKGGMEATYEGQLSRIEEELDLSIEARNVVKGALYDKPLHKGQKSDGVRAMKLDDMVAPTVNSMVLEKAPGETLDRYMEELRKKESALMSGLYLRDGTGKIRTHNGRPMVVGSTMTYEDGQKVVTARRELHRELESLLKRHEYMATLAEKWVTEGIFQEGFYHGDLHAGNIMVNDDGVTMIDFGNATSLDKDQRVNVTLMVGAAAVGDVEGFKEGLHNLLDEEFEDDYKAAENELTASLNEIFSLGDCNCAGQRIALALLKAQELRLQVPSAIFNFSQSQLRLQNAMESMEKQIDDLRLDLAELDRVSVNPDAFLDVSVSLSMDLRNDQAYNKDNKYSVKSQLKVQAEKLDAVISEFDYEDEASIRKYITDGKVSKDIEHVDEDINAITANATRQLDRIIAKPDDETVLSSVKSSITSSVGKLGACMEVRDLVLRTEKLVRDFAKANKEGDQGARGTFDTGLQQIIAELNARKGPALVAAEKLRAYNAKKDSKKALDELVAAYKPLHKYRFGRSSVTGTMRMFLRGTEIPAGHVAQSENEIKSLIAKDAELGPQLEKAFTELKAFRGRELDDISGYVAKENEVVDLIYKITMKEFKEMREKCGGNSQMDPTDFITVMGTTIKAHLHSALGRLGFVRSITYGRKLS